MGSVLGTRCQTIWTRQTKRFPIVVSDAHLMKMFQRQEKKNRDWHVRYTLYCVGLLVTFESFTSFLPSHTSHAGDSDLLSYFCSIACNISELLSHF